MNTQIYPIDNQIKTDLPSQPVPLKSMVKTTLWLLVFIFVPQMIVGFFAGLYFGATHGANMEPEAFNTWFTTVPMLLSSSFVATLLFLSPLLIKATPGNNWQQRRVFLGLNLVTSPVLLKHLLLSAGFWLLLTLVGIALQQPVEPFMQTMKTGLDTPALIVFALVVICIVAPIAEELIYRGWLFTKIAQTKLGNLGAILISSLVFAAIHSQYQYAFTFVSVFALGLLLSWVRYKTQNISYTIVMHMLFNILAMFSLFIFSI